MQTEYPPVVLGPEGLGSYEAPPVEHRPWASMSGPSVDDDKPLKLPTFGKVSDATVPPILSRTELAWVLFGLGLALGAVLARF